MDPMRIVIFLKDPDSWSSLIGLGLGTLMKLDQSYFWGPQLSLGRAILIKDGPVRILPWVL